MAYLRGIKPNFGLDVANVFAALLGKPKVADVDWFVTTANEKNGAHTIVTGHNATDDDPVLARNVTVTATQVGGVTDTQGKLTITGTNIAGKVITEDIIPAVGSTVAGTKAFRTVTSIVQSGWTAGGTADTLTVGYGNLIGLPAALFQAPTQTAASIFAVLFGNALVAITVTSDADEIEKNTVDASAGTYNGTKTLIALIAR